MKVILFEYDLPVSRSRLFNHDIGKWYWKMEPGTVTVDDSSANTGYYEYNNASDLVIKSLRWGTDFYAKVNTEAEMDSTESTFWIDSATSIIYIHSKNGEPPTIENIYVGVVTGYCYGQATSYYFNDTYYEPRMKEVFSINRSKDPLYYGIQKYSSLNVSMINADGHFDNWRSLNLFSQPARILYGETTTQYTSYEQLYQGYLENDNRDFTNFAVTIQDQRKSYTQTVDRNLLTKSEYPHLADDDVDKSKPVAYGQRFNEESICLNKEETTPGMYYYLICDTEFNSVESVETVYKNGTALVLTTDYTVDLTGGVIAIETTSVDPTSDDITIDFTMPIKNGVEIIKDLLFNYEGLTYISSFWDITEVNSASLISRNTSLYLDSSVKLKDAIESVSNDIDGYFFRKDNGLFTIRIYDSNRSITKTLIEDEWIGDPKFINNGSEYLTSAIIKYRKDGFNGTSYKHEELSYEDTAFNTYKRYKSETFETNLYTLTDSQAKANNILQFSTNIEDIIKRRVSWDHRDLELMDFVIGSPQTRINESAVRGVYEIIGVNKDLANWQVELTMRYVKADPTYIYNYTILIDESSNFIVDESGNTIAGAE